MRLVVTRARLNYYETVGSAPATKAPKFAGKDLPYCDELSVASGWGSVKWGLILEVYHMARGGN